MEHRRFLSVNRSAGPARHISPVRPAGPALLDSFGAKARGLVVPEDVVRYLRVAREKKGRVGCGFLP